MFLVSVLLMRLSYYRVLGHSIEHGFMEGNMLV